MQLDLTCIYTVAIDRSVTAMLLSLTSTFSAKKCQISLCTKYLDASFLLKGWKKPHHLQLPLTAIGEDVVILYIL